MRRKTHEEYVAELNRVNPRIEVIGQYSHSHKPIRVRCRECGYEWEVPAYNLLRGTGCRECILRKKTKPHEVFVKEVSETSPNVEIVGTYVNSNTKVACRCRICGYRWATRPSVLLRGGGCPRCAGNAPRDNNK